MTVSPYSTASSSYTSSSIYSSRSATTTDTKGKITNLTNEDAKKAPEATTALYKASKTAQSLRMQAEAIANTKRADRVADVAKQSEEVITNIKETLKTLSEDSTVDEKTLKSFKEAASSILSSLDTVSSKLSSVADKAHGADTEKTKSALEDLKKSGSELAKSLGKEWGASEAASDVSETETEEETETTTNARIASIEARTKEEQSALEKLNNGASVFSSFLEQSWTLSYDSKKNANTRSNTSKLIDIVV